MSSVVQSKTLLLDWLVCPNWLAHQTLHLFRRMVDISSNDTACLDLVLLISRRSFLDERDRAANKGLRALEVLEEIVLIDSRIT